VFPVLPVSPELPVLSVSPTLYFIAPESHETARKTSTEMIKNLFTLNSPHNATDLQPPDCNITPAFFNYKAEKNRFLN